eukprot:COSAG06_NODE_30987_length_528_cov_58.037296_1_plen_49_part_10
MFVPSLSCQMYAFYIVQNGLENERCSYRARRGLLLQRLRHPLHLRLELL